MSAPTRDPFTPDPAEPPRPAVRAADASLRLEDVLHELGSLTAGQLAAYAEDLEQAADALESVHAAANGVRLPAGALEARA